MRASELNSKKLIIFDIRSHINMKLFRTTITLIILIGFVKPTIAQRNLLLESIQVYSNILPNANYYKPDSAALESLLNAFEIGIAQKLNFQIVFL